MIPYIIYILCLIGEINSEPVGESNLYTIIAKQLQNITLDNTGSSSFSPDDRRVWYNTFMMQFVYNNSNITYKSSTPVILRKCVLSPEFHAILFKDTVDMGEYLNNSANGCERQGNIFSSRNMPTSMLQYIKPRVLNAHYHCLSPNSQQYVDVFTYVTTIANGVAILQDTSVHIDCMIGAGGVFDKSSYQLISQNQKPFFYKKVIRYYVVEKQNGKGPSTKVVKVSVRESTDELKNKMKEDFTTNKAHVFWVNNKMERIKTQDKREGYIRFNLAHDTTLIDSDYFQKELKDKDNICIKGDINKSIIMSSIKSGHIPPNINMSEDQLNKTIKDIKTYSNNTTTEYTDKDIKAFIDNCTYSKLSQLYIEFNFNNGTNVSTISTPIFNVQRANEISANLKTLKNNNNNNKRIAWNIKLDPEYVRAEEEKKYYNKNPWNIYLLNEKESSKKKIFAEIGTSSLIDNPIDNSKNILFYYYDGPNEKSALSFKISISSSTWTPKVESK
eukprot:GHVR01084369.1.p1 GENE.GHVR01084369.1~~GHVR01084369.1.p1  ORF type:complete len:501 (+),score=92.03 GHVR01084369.1:54-1556(+)